MFKKKSEKKQKDANKLIDYQNKRGGTVLLNNIKLYDIEKDWHNGLGALEVGLELEKSLNQSIFRCKLKVGRAGRPQWPHQSQYLIPEIVTK